MKDQDTKAKTSVLSSGVAEKWEKQIAERGGHNQESVYHIFAGERLLARVRGEDNASTLIDAHNAAIALAAIQKAKAPWNLLIRSHQEAWNDLAKLLGVKCWPIQQPRFVFDKISSVLAALAEAEKEIQRLKEASDKSTHVLQKSVQPSWCVDLPIQQQSVLLLAARGPDGIAKAHPCKKIQLAYRATVLLAAYLGRSMRWGESADGFMSLDNFSSEAWPIIVDEFFQHADDLPHHYLMHLMHGAEILGYKHPDPRFRLRWQAFYQRCAGELHLSVESELAMDQRLSDWERKHWSEASVP